MAVCLTGHSRARGNPGLVCAKLAWIPAFAGMTDPGRLFVSWIATDVFSKECTKFGILIIGNLRVLRTTILDNLRGLRKLSERQIQEGGFQTTPLPIPILFCAPCVLCGHSSHRLRHRRARLFGVKRLSQSNRQRAILAPRFQTLHILARIRLGGDDFG